MYRNEPEQRTGFLRCPRCGASDQIHFTLREVGRKQCSKCGRNNFYCFYLYDGRDRQVSEVWSFKDSAPEEPKCLIDMAIYLYMPAVQLKWGVANVLLKEIKRRKSGFFKGVKPMVFDVITDGAFNLLAEHTGRSMKLPNRIGSDVFNYGYPSAYFEECVSRMCERFVVVYPTVHIRSDQVLYCRESNGIVGPVTSIGYKPPEINRFEESVKRIPETNKYYIGVAA